MSGMIGGMAGAPGKYNEGKVKRDISRFNTYVLSAQKEAAKAKTKYELLLHSRDVRSKIGTQKAMFAAAGVESEGTPLAIMAETAGTGAEKARLIQYAGDVEVADWYNKMLMNSFEGKLAFKAGQMGAISSAFGGVASGAESAYSMGAFG